MDCGSAADAAASPVLAAEPETLQGIAASLPADDPRRKTLDASMQAHAAAGLRYVFSGHYEGEHWLATFAVYHLTATGAPPQSGGK